MVLSRRCGAGDGDLIPMAYNGLHDVLCTAGSIAVCGTQRCLVRTRTWSQKRWDHCWLSPPRIANGTCGGEWHWLLTLRWTWVLFLVITAMNQRKPQNPQKEIRKKIWVVVSDIFYFHPYLGKWSNLTDIFQQGWFNHQLEILGTKNAAKWKFPASLPVAFDVLQPSGPHTPRSKHSERDRRSGKGIHSGYLYTWICLTAKVKGQLGVPLTLYPWYLLCSLGILGDYNP